MKFIVLIIGSVCAYLLLKYREKIKNMIGDIAFAEKFFGNGGTYNMIIIVSILVFIFSLMYATGTLEDLTVKVFGGLF